MKSIIKYISIVTLFLLSCGVHIKRVNPSDGFDKKTSLKMKDEIIEKVFFGNTKKTKSLIAINKQDSLGSYIGYYETGKIFSFGFIEKYKINDDKQYFDTVWIQNINLIGAFEQYIFELKSCKMGSWSYFYSNGNIQITGDYYKNFRDGEWKFYSPQGNLEIIRKYLRGKFISDSIVSTSFVIPPNFGNISD